MKNFKQITKELLDEWKNLERMEEGQIGDFPMAVESKEKMKEIFKGSLAQRHYWETKQQIWTLIQVGEYFISVLDGRLGIITDNELVHKIGKECEEISESLLKLKDAVSLTGGLK